MKSVLSQPIHVSLQENVSVRVHGGEKKKSATPNCLTLEAKRQTDDSCRGMSQEDYGPHSLGVGEEVEVKIR